MASSGGKKGGICRYFAQNGECFYGHDCQFIHSRGGAPILQNPSSSMINHVSASLGSHSHGMIDTASNTPPHILGQTTLASHHQPQQLQNHQHLHQNQTANNTISNATAVSLAASMANIHLSQQQHQHSIVTDESDLVEQLPERISDYIDLYHLKSPVGVANSFGCVTSVYRATNIETNQFVCMRRVHAFQSNPINSKSLLDIIDAWKKIQCPNIVRLLQVFTTRAFGDNSLVFIYQYHPQSTSFMQQYFSPTSAGGGVNGFNPGIVINRPYSQQQAILKNKLLPEPLLWHYIIQLTSALRSIHSQGLAYRILDASKVLITTQVPNCPPYQLQPSQYPRIRLNVCGLFDAVTHDLTLENPAASNMKAFIHQMQQDDLNALGRLCLSLATCSLLQTTADVREYWQQSLDMISRTYSPDLRNLIMTLLSKQITTNSNQQQQPQLRNINDIVPMIDTRFYLPLKLAHEKIDAMQAELDREAVNGRLLRILIKLGMINERPELRMDMNWSETGDRYMLKLFRDYIFHQLNEDGTPWLDMGHVVSTLLKFDVGSPEKICLISRDENHVLVVSFAELKKCFESSIVDLTS